MKKMKNIQVLTISAMLLALATIFGLFLKIPVTNLIEIRFGEIPIAIGGTLFGPGIGAIIGALADILQYVVKPTGPYFPGFTISSAVSGVIFGLILKVRNGRVSLPRIVIAESFHTLVVSIVINTLNLYLLYGKPSEQGIEGYFTYMVTRLPKSLIMWPINIILLYLIMRVIPFGRIMQEIHGQGKNQDSDHNGDH